MIIQFLVGLSIIVGLHELGHMLFARWFGMRVEKFSIGFPPKIFSFKIGHTSYALGAIPLGGSVKIAGMIDEYLEQKEIKNPQPWEFVAKPAWQRWLVIMGGIIFNLITGVLIYIVLTFACGESFISKKNMNIHGIFPHTLGQTIGFQKGDKILDINGKDFTRFSDLMNPYHLLNGGYYTVLRNGQTLTLHMPANFLEKLSSKKTFFLEPLQPFSVKQVIKDSIAANIGLQPGDTILTIHGTSARYFQELIHCLQQYKGQTVDITIARGTSLIIKKIMIPITGKLGFCPEILLPVEKKSYGLADAIMVGTHKAFDVIWTNALGLVKVFTGKLSATQSLSGPIGIAKIFGTQFNFIHFWRMIGLLSMVLAFVNFLPIPALDGGHGIFLIYEMITGRSLPTRFLLFMQKVGILILLSLAIFTIFNDIYKLF